jgi:hypothetical protein
MVEPLALAGVQLYGQEGSADALNAINDSIDGILPDRNAGQSRMDVLEQEIAAGNLTDFEDFAEQVATAASGLGASESDVIAGLATLDNEFPGVFNSFIAANPVAAAAAAPQPPRALPPTAAVPRAVAATPPRPPPTVARLPTLPLGVKTRDDLRALTESEVRDFGRALSAAYGGPYVSRAGTKKATQITTLINKIKMIVPGF